MGQKSSLPQLSRSVSKVLMPDIPATQAVAAKGDKPHRPHGLAQSAHPAKASEPPEVIPLD
jgi:hypothetical protein